MNVFLIGFMGSGKTSVGKKLAKLLKLQFIDLDNEIESAEGLSIQAIFETKGEDYFRTLEHDWLKSARFENALISLGGGTPCFHDNIDVMKTKGCIVYLKLDTRMLANRIMQSKTVRPLMEPYRDNIGAMTDKINEMLLNRVGFYEQAHLVYDASSMSKTKLDQLANQIQKLIG